MYRYKTSFIPLLFLSFAFPIQSLGVHLESGSRWIGDYTCLQGRTDLELTVLEVKLPAVKAIFHFRHNLSQTEGRFYLKGQYAKETGDLTFEPGEWIEQPIGYSSMGMAGKILDDPVRYEGNIPQKNCGTFNVKPATSPGFPVIPDSVPDLIWQLRKPNDPDVKQRILLALRESDMTPHLDDAVPALFQAIREDQQGLYDHMASAALEKVGGEIEKQLQAALEDENGNLRDHAFILLSKIDPAKAQDALKKIKIEEEVPHIIRNIELITAYSSDVQYERMALEKLSLLIRKGQYSWFKDPIEVCKRYANKFGISENATFALQENNCVIAKDGDNSLKFEGEQDDQLSLWRITTFTNLNTNNHAQVKEDAVSIEIPPGLSWDKLFKKFRNNSTSLFLSIQRPLISVSINREMDPATVNSKTVRVEFEGKPLSGVKAKFNHKQVVYRGKKYFSPQFSIDLTAVKNLAQAVGKNIRITLTDGIKNKEGGSLVPCQMYYTPGQCLEEPSGAKIKSFAFEVRVYSAK